MRSGANEVPGDPLPIPHPTDVRSVQNRWEHVRDTKKDHSQAFFTYEFTRRRLHG